MYAIDVVQSVEKETAEGGRELITFQLEYEFCTHINHQLFVFHFLRVYVHPHALFRVVAVLLFYFFFVNGFQSLALC